MIECSKESSEGLLHLEMALLSESTLELFFSFSFILLIGQRAMSMLLSEFQDFVSLFFSMTLQGVSCWVPVVCILTEEERERETEKR